MRLRAADGSVGYAPGGVVRSASKTRHPAVLSVEGWRPSCFIDVRLWTGGGGGSMRLSTVLGAAPLAAFACPVAAQSIDSHEEAWAIAARQSVTPAEWTLVNWSLRDAIFIRKLTSGPYRPESWVVFIFADNLTAEFRYIHANCQTSEYWSTQSSTRDWRGGFLGSAGAKAPERAVPGSVGEAIVSDLCPPVIVPGPPRS